MEEAMRLHNESDERRFNGIHRGIASVNAALAGITPQPPLAVRLDRLEVAIQDRAKRDDKANRMLLGLISGVALMVVEAFVRLLLRR